MGGTAIPPEAVPPVFSQLDECNLPVFAVVDPFGNGCIGRPPRQ